MNASPQVTSSLSTVCDPSLREDTCNPVKMLLHRYAQMSTPRWLQILSSWQLKLSSTLGFCHFPCFIDFSLVIFCIQLHCDFCHISAACLDVYLLSPFCSLYVGPWGTSLLFRDFSSLILMNSVCFPSSIDLATPHKFWDVLLLFEHSSMWSLTFFLEIPSLIYGFFRTVLNFPTFRNLPIVSHQFLDGFHYG